MIEKEIVKQLPENDDNVDSHELNVKVTALCVTTKEDIFIDLREESE